MTDPRTRILLGFLAGLILLTPAAHAEPGDRQNNHGAAFLRAGVDARHLGMGGAGAGLAEGVAAGYWNPAGLARLRGYSFTGMTTQKLNFDRRHNYVAGAWGGEHVALGVSWISAGTEDIPLTTDATSVPGSFDFKENAILFSAAAQAGKAYVGVNAKVITQDLGTSAPGGGDDNALGYGVDLGAQFFVTQFARVGFVVQDLFAEVGSRDVENINQIPANLRLGLALELVDGFTVTSDMEKTRDTDDVRFHTGGEFKVPLGNNLTGAVRLGVNEGDFSGGFGLEVGTFQFDYAYVIEPEAFLDENHRFSLTLGFGTTRQLIREGGNEDLDFDGFADDEDDCPDDPEDFDSFEDFDGCPEDDNDGDGLLDFDDACPDEAEDMDGFEDEDGCPDPDNDGDGVLDGDDACPDEAETANGFQDGDGCPDASGSVLPPVQLHFASGSAALPADAGEVLEGVERILMENPALRLEIQGHTDDQGDADQNLMLSDQRAQAVRGFLISRGIDAGRLDARGLGETSPVADNTTAEGRKQNRRIEFVSIP